MTDLSDFLESIITDKPVASNRYTILISGTTTNSKSASAATMLNCNMLSIPSLNLELTHDRRQGLGITQSFPNGKSLNPIMLGFYESESFKERNFFSQWFNEIYNPISKKIAFFDNIAKTIQINQLDRQNNIIYTVKLYEAVVTHVSELNRSYHNQSSIDNMSVSISYNDMEEIFYTNGQPITNSFPVPNYSPTVGATGAPITFKTGSQDVIGQAKNLVGDFPAISTTNEIA